MKRSRAASTSAAFVALMWGGSAIAGPCDNTVPLQKGTTAELTRYDATHVATGKIVGTIVSSVVEGDKITAVEMVDNYHGNTKVGPSIMLDVVCDGKTYAIKMRNDEAMKNFALTASEIAKTGQKVLSGASVTDPQVYPVDLKVGAQLTPYRMITVSLIQKAPPDWGSIAGRGDWMQALRYAMHGKFASSLVMATTNIKVVAQETCTLPSGAPSPCFRITKEMYAKPIAGEANLAMDANTIAKGGAMTPITEWFVPGAGVVKLEIGKPVVISMVMTKLSVPSAAPPPAPPVLTPPPTPPPAPTPAQ